MERYMNKMLAVSLLAGASLGVPAQAAVIDDVKRTVNQIRSDTTALKRKTADLQDRVEELGHTANTQIAESLDIRQLVEPLSMLQPLVDELANAGIDPSEIMGAIDTSELTAKLDELRARQAEMQALVNDPGLADFKYELLDLLRGIDSLASGPGDRIEAAPFEAVLENAPAIALVPLKIAASDLMPALQTTVDAAVLGMRAIAEYGIDIYERGTIQCVAENAAAPAYLVVRKYVADLNALHYYLQRVQIHWEAKSENMPELPRIGVHGYFQIKLPSTDMDLLSLRILELERAIEKWSALEADLKEQALNPNFCNVIAGR